MSNLWEPDRHTRSLLNSGERKMKLDFLKKTGYLKPAECQYCGREVYSTPYEDLFYTLGGSIHKCKGMPEE